jgi:hypothetical protein
MSELKVQTNQNRSTFEPGEELIGTAGWKLDQPPRAVELRLFWFTRGKGFEDTGLVETVRFDRPLLEETRPFRLRLPVAPYSFAGKLISLIWALELVAEPLKQVSRMEFVLGPEGREVHLESVPQSHRKQRPFE